MDDLRNLRGPSPFEGVRWWRSERLFVWTGGVLLIGLVGFLDYITGPYISFSIFYFLPVGLMAWHGGRMVGTVGSVLAAASWFLAQTGEGAVYSSAAIPYWNAIVELLSFLVLTHIACALKGAMRHQAELARTDDLTGLANRRHFFELAEMEIQRARRYAHPFSLAYVDFDHFKKVNDGRGHAEGDRLLRAATRTILDSIRSTDVMARTGGDEFAVLMPETGPEAAMSVQRKIWTALQERVGSSYPEVTVSVGLATWLSPPASTDEMMREADALMYAAKEGGRNCFKQAVLNP